MKRVLYFAYGMLCYVAFLATFAYAAGFLGNLIVPKSIDSGPAVPVAEAVVVNLLLLTLFGLQHSVMARPTFKRWWTRFVPAPIERSTYVLLSNVVLALLFWQWRPIHAVVWDVQLPAARVAVYALWASGWAIVFISTVLLNHLDLFGVRQVWLYLRGKPYTHVPFHAPLFYARMRHPLYLGWTLTFWAAPTMTAGHLLFAVVAVGYMLIAIQFEERNLLEFHGEKYAAYRRSVPMMLPLPGRRFSAPAMASPVPSTATSNMA